VTVDTQSITLDTLRATQRTQEAEIGNLRKQIEEKEDVSKRYTKRIAELTKEIESQYVFYGSFFACFLLID
jgi:hypothetical protein